MWVSAPVSDIPMAHSQACSSLLLLFIPNFLQAQSTPVLGLWNPAVPTNRSGADFELTASSLCDPVSLKAFGEHWQGDYTPRNGPQGFLASIMAQLRWEEPWGQCTLWHSAYLQLLGSRGTMDLLRETKTHQDLQVGKTFEIEVSAMGLERTGTTLGRSWSLTVLPDLRINGGLGVKAWWGHAAQDGSINGKAQATAPNTYDFNFAVDYRYTHNLLYDLSVEAAQGLGGALVFGAQVSYRSWQFDLVVDDILARTWWKNMPFTAANAVSRRQHLDPSGYFEFDPTIEGREGRGNWVQKQPVPWAAGLVWTGPDYGSGLRFERISNFTFCTLQVTRGWGGTNRSALSFEPRTRAWGFDYGKRDLRWGFSMQKLRPDRAHSLSLRIGWAWGR